MAGALQVLRGGRVVGTVTGTALDTADRRLWKLWRDGVQASQPGGDDDRDAREIVQIKPGHEGWRLAHAEGLGRLGYDVNEAFRRAAWTEQEALDEAAGVIKPDLADADG